MDFKDYYAALGVERGASAEDIKRSYRKLARKYHPDVSKQPDAETRFKDIAEAYEVIGDAERRAAYDAVASSRKQGQEFNPPPGWNSGFEFGGFEFGGGDFGMGGDGDHSAFFDALFRNARRQGSRAPAPAGGGDHHAKVQIELRDSYCGGQRSISLRTPTPGMGDSVTMQDRQLDVNIPKGIRPGQHLRLAGQGSPAQGGLPAGDLYLEIEFAPHPLFRLDGADLYIELPVAPWEAALGASLTVPMPDGRVQLNVPAGSSPGRKLRLKGKGLPGAQAGDLYVLLHVALPPADTDAARQAYEALARAFPDFNPRRLLEA